MRHPHLIPRRSGKETYFHFRGFIPKDLIPKKIFSIEYQNLYTSSLRMFYDYKITGVGPRMFRYLCVEKKLISSKDASVISFDRNALHR